ncbi:inducible metalloproteinase inhibitor protein-like [Spodoptera litura]|uniref:Inducible metalloproteinase inhibitor protein-like n=1 Tax=Spodoptera litura TaxID=69820 RepID=A0A9J7DVL2_SPOLT|nr:inducible metalloproteinase inhibitor protein-like [Spodoptera litura]
MISKMSVKLFLLCVTISVNYVTSAGLVCDRENEHYECGSACQTTCATLGTVCPIVNIRCNDACYCDEGFARDDNGICIPEGECPRRSRERRAHKKPASICPGEFEVYTDCYKDCPPNTCLSLVAKFKCDGSEPCKKGCVCQSGYLRQKADTPCIPIRECMEMKNAPQS